MVDAVVAVEHEHGLRYGALAVGAEFEDGDDAVESCATGRPGVCEIHLAVLVPQRHGVYHAASGLNEHRLAPFAPRVGCLCHEYAEVRVAPVDIVHAVVPAYARRPHAFAVARRGVVEVVGRHGRQCVVDYLPVHEVGAVEYRQPRRAREARRRHPVVALGTAHGIRVGIVGEDNGIFIHAVAEVGHPHLGYLGRYRRGTQHGYGCEYNCFFHIAPFYSAIYGFSRNITQYSACSLTKKVFTLQVSS